MIEEDIDRNLNGFQLFHLASLHGVPYAEPAVACERVLVGWAHWVGHCFEIDPLPGFAIQFSNGIIATDSVDRVEVSFQI